MEAKVRRQNSGSFVYELFGEVPISRTVPLRKVQGTRCTVE